MRIKYLYGVFLLVFICSALADEEKNKTFVEEIQKTIDTVLREPTHCQSDSDCHHLGKCVSAQDGIKTCRCKSGTSGDLCEKVDECVDNPVKCGVQKDVSCVFDVVEEQAVCKCDNESKTYVVDKERCMSPCTIHPCPTNKPCKNDGFCGHKIGDQMFCTCHLGYSGDYCEIIDECKDVDCGSGPDVECRLNNLNMRAYCRCSNPELFAFDNDEKICKRCNCGIYSRMCTFSDGQKVCDCSDGFVQNRIDGICTRCDCGVNGNCTLDRWAIKTCDCDKGYIEQCGICQECDCGENGRCDFNYGKKECHCVAGYESYQGTCKECNCGYNGVCKFDSFGYKECKCRSGYGKKAGVCTHCDCGLRDSNCTMYYGIKHCQCPKGYEALPSFWDVSCKDIDECLHPLDNDCPTSTKCVNKPGSYDCVCKEGYELPTSIDYDIKKFGCQDIDECVGDVPACSNLHDRCINTPGSYRCDCTAGYSVEKNSYGEKYSFCVEDARPWRTATIVVGCLLGVVTLVLLFCICTMRCIDI